MMHLKRISSVIICLAGLLMPVFTCLADTSDNEYQPAKRVEISVTSKGCPFTISVPKVNPRKIAINPSYKDGFHPNHGNFVKIARFNGQPVMMGFDGNTLTRCIKYGNSIIVSDISLEYKTSDTKANTVTFRRGLKQETIDFK